MKKVLTYLVVFFAIGTLVTVVSLSVLDNFLYSMSQSTTFVSQDEKSKSENIIEGNKIKIEDGATNLQYSFNNKYYTYLKDSKIYINNVKDGENFAIIEEDKAICYYNLLYDKNLIIYLTAEQTTKTNTRLVINTYDIASKRKSTYNKFNVTNFSCVKDMNMSPIINIIYINIETKNSNDKENNTIYRVDLFNSMSQVKSGTIFKKMIMLQHKDRVYYEDEKNNIYSGSTKLNIFKKDVKMIGIDYDDNLYFLTEDNQTVYKVKDNKILRTIDLQDTNIVTTYTNNIGTYIIYSTHVIDVSSKEPLKRISRMSEYVKFEAIKDDTMYLRTSDNSLVTTKILLEDIEEEEQEENDKDSEKKN